MELYIYDAETMVHIATAEGDSNEECEAKASAYGDEYFTTYSPAFGFNGGLIENQDAEIL